MTSETQQPDRATIDFDHHSPEHSRAAGELGIGPLLNDIRDKCPVAWTESNGGYWLVTGHREVREISRKDTLFSSDHDPQGLRKGYTGVTIPPNFPVPLGFIEMDAPDHTDIRKAVMPWFSIKAAERWRPVIEELTTAFIDSVIERGECEFIGEVASPISTIMTMKLMGAPLDRWRTWSSGFHGQVASSPGAPEREIADQEMMVVLGEIEELIRDRQRNPESGPASDLTSYLCQVELGGRKLEYDEIFRHSVLFGAGGIHTTATAATSTIKWLSKHPEQREYLRNCSDEELDTAIDEFLRVFAPVAALARTATDDYRIGGQTIKAEDRVLLMYATANYDPAVFANPEEVDLTRSPNPHATFGLGPHRCAGQHFARTLLSVLIRQFLHRVPDFTVDHSEMKIHPDIGVNQGWIAMPLTFTPGKKVGETHFVIP